MKAFLLAGGLGTRLGRLTDTQPKCLVDVGGEPLLASWLELCLREGISSVLINVSRHADLVRSFLSAWTRRLDITLVEEAEPLGSAGTVRANRAFVAGESSFYVFYTDTVVEATLEGLRACHASHTAPLTVGLFRTDRPEQAGIATLDPWCETMGRIVEFVEKPASPVSNLASAGVYLARPALLDEIQIDRPPIDFGYHVLPLLAGRMYGYVLDGRVIDAGTPEGLVAARALRGSCRA